MRNYSRRISVAASRIAAEEDVNNAIKKYAEKNARQAQDVKNSKVVFQGNVLDARQHMVAIRTTDLATLLETNFDYIPTELRNNPSLIHVALSKLGFELFGEYIDKFITSEKLSDSEFMLAMVKGHGIRILDFADESLTSNPDFMYMARDIQEHSKVDHSKKHLGTKRENIQPPLSGLII